MDAEREPGRPTGDQVPTRLLDVERSSLDEHVGGDGDPAASGRTCSIAQSMYASASGCSGGTACAPNQVGTPPAARDGLELGEFGIAIEPVAALPLECRRAVGEHRVAVAGDDLAKLGRARCTGGARRREDPAAGREQLLVRRPART